MTANQINYARLKEEQRSNAANEGIKSQSLSEEQRHNLETERINWYGADTSRTVGMTNAQAALSQAGAANVQAAVRKQAQDWEESKYNDTGRNWISAQTDKLTVESSLRGKELAEYRHYTPQERAFMQKNMDVMNWFMSPFKAAAGLVK